MTNYFENDWYIYIILFILDIFGVMPKRITAGGNTKRPRRTKKTINNKSQRLDKENDENNQLSFSLRNLKTKQNDDESNNFNSETQQLIEKSDHSQMRRSRKLEKDLDYITDIRKKKIIQEEIADIYKDDNTGLYVSKYQMKRRWSLYTNWQNSVEDGKVWIEKIPSVPNFNFNFWRNGGRVPVIKWTKRSSNPGISIDTEKTLNEDEYKNLLKEQEIIVKKFIKKYNTKWKGQYKPITKNDPINLSAALNFLGDDLDEEFLNSKRILLFLEENIDKPKSEYSDNDLHDKLLNECFNKESKNKQNDAPVIMSKATQNGKESKLKWVSSSWEVVSGKSESEEMIEYPEIRKSKNDLKRIELL